MIISNKVVVGEFIRRPNRFQAFVYINGVENFVHVPNTGRCREILIPGAKVVLREENNPLRKTKYDLIAGYKGTKLINIDSQIPNKVVEEALRNKAVSEVKQFLKIEREKTYGNSRFDFKLSNLHDEYYLEVKGVTLEIDGKAMFPDAPTDRGRKHLLELVEAKKAGKGAGVLFLMQMSEIKVFSPYDAMDKPFGDALRYAASQGVDIMAYECDVEESLITLSNKVKVILG